MNWKQVLNENKNLSPGGVDRRILGRRDRYHSFPKPFIGCQEGNDSKVLQVSKMMDYAALLRKHIYEKNAKWPTRVRVGNQLVTYNRMFEVNLGFTFQVDDDPDRVTVLISNKELERVEDLRWQSAMFLN